MRTVRLPCYLLRDEEIEGLIARATEVMSELAGETDTSELPGVIQELRDEMAARGKPVLKRGDGAFEVTGKGNA